MAKKQDKVAANVLSNPEDRKKLNKLLKDCSDSLTRCEAEKAFIKEQVSALCEDMELEKKIVNRMVKTFHKQSFDEETVENENFETIYELVVKPNGNN